MAAQLNFRTSFNGFNREDVVHYIEYMNTKHAGEISQLNSELDYLRTRQVELPAPDADQEETIALQATRIRELFDRCKALEEELEALKAEKEQLIAQANKPVEEPKAEVPKSCVEEELEAYRRAERAERYARERAENLYRQATGALADATIKVDDAANQVAQMSDKVIAQLAELQEVVAGSKQSLRDAAATMYTIRPNL